jgi:predicted ATPase
MLFGGFGIAISMCTVATWGPPIHRQPRPPGDTDVALQIDERTGERLFAAELNTRKGQLLQRQGKPETAEERYRKALSIAVEQEAKLWELRAAMSLARLLCDQGHRAEARDLLAPVYGWCSEGFDTPDLKDAKTLLSELNT